MVAICSKIRYEYFCNSFSHLLFQVPDVLFPAEHEYAVFPTLISIPDTETRIRWQQKYCFSPLPTCNVYLRSSTRSMLMPLEFLLFCRSLCFTGMVLLILFPLLYIPFFNEFFVFSLLILLILFSALHHYAGCQRRSFMSSSQSATLILLTTPRKYMVLSAMRFIHHPITDYRCPVSKPCTYSYIA